MQFLLAVLATSLPWLTHARQFRIGEVDSAVNHMLQVLHVNRTFTETHESAPHVSAFEHFQAASSSYWYENIQKQGVSAFGPSGYKVFRNVKTDFGARGDGVTDDTAAIQNAIASGGRCGKGCTSSTTTPAVVYFPAGTYLVANEIFDYYNTILIGDPTNLPTIKASANFNNGNGGWIIDGNPYFTSNLNWVSTNVFFRQVRNLILDTTAVPANVQIRGIHWPTSQATSLQNMVFNMNAASGTLHQGVFCESGSAGFMSDLTFNGGGIGLAVGNQQFTIRGLTFNNVVTAISHYWDWGFTYSDLTIRNCGTAIDITAGGSNALATGSIVLLDSTISNTPVGIKTGWTSSSQPPTGNSVILENVQISNVGAMIQNNGATVLNGGTGTISAWGQGHRYTPSGPQVFSGAVAANSRPSSLLSNGAYYMRSKPQYANLPVSSFVSARSSGARGDGNTDDTTALQNAINAATSAGKVLFVDAGTYIVTNTITIPPGAKIVGEAYSTIMSSGGAFANINSPRPVVRVGSSGQTGQVEWSDMLVSTRGAQAGAVLIEWNLSGSGTPSGMWDVHTRIGGAAGTNLQVAQCSKNPGSSNVNANCIGGYMHMHVTPGASNLYMENNWFWTADHDIEDPNNTQLTVFSGRGLYVESSAGPVWLWGTGVEHNQLYQFQLANTANIFMGLIQTETPYYQPLPNALVPFSPVSSLNDPNFQQSCAGQGGNCATAWGLRVLNSHNVLVYGAGLYSFFNNYATSCSTASSGGPGPENCQTNMATLDGSNSNVRFYGLSTIGATNMLVSGGNNVLIRQSDNANAFAETVALFSQ